MSVRIESVDKYFKGMDRLQELYEGAFPEEERVPMWILLWRAKKNHIHFKAFYDEHTFVGFTYLIVFKDITFVFYLAIDNQIRSKGYGSQVLTKIKEMYPNNRIILNIEAVEEEASNHEQRTQRKSFYLRNGYQNSKLTISQFNQSYEVMVHGQDITKGELRGVFKSFMGSLLYWFSRPEISELQD
ncbi:GNAT family N-acetyltransferase [Paenibacillus massiliensis]|uniref:GNAT family N-acetyltransferase n=1 Tax=Paenibacillus massiliensis TaxID=225917 RepID=UPI00042352A3|nr:GNAT family N-acetyltransferase [Paenibacillus massiliensis]